METINLPSLIVIAIIVFLIVVVFFFLRKKGGSCPQKKCTKLSKQIHSSCLTGQMKEFSHDAIECQACSPLDREKCKNQ